MLHGVDRCAFAGFARGCPASSPPNSRRGTTAPAFFDCRRREASRAKTSTTKMLLGIGYSTYEPYLGEYYKGGWASRRR